MEILGIVPESQASNGLSGTVEAMKQVPLSDVKDDLSKYLRLAETEVIVIRPAGVLVGFGSEDDWFGTTSSSMIRDFFDGWNVLDKACARVKAFPWKNATRRS